MTPVLTGHLCRYIARLVVDGMQIRAQGVEPARTGPGLVVADLVHARGQKAVEFAIARILVSNNSAGAGGRRTNPVASHGSAPLPRAVRKWDLRKECEPL